MTNKEKSEILRLRGEGYSLAGIAGELHIPFNTVKSFLYRAAKSAREREAADPRAAAAALHSDIASAEVYKPCLCCGKDVGQAPHRKEKKFCCAACRVRWWNRNAAESHGSRIKERTCPSCGRKFRAYGPRKYCSHACYIAARFGKEREG